MSYGFFVASRDLANRPRARNLIQVCCKKKHPKYEAILNLWVDEHSPRQFNTEHFQLGGRLVRGMAGNPQVTAGGNLVTSGL